MAERSSLNQNVQIGVETVHGTAVPATKRLQSIGIEPSVSVEKDNFRPIGSKFSALSTLGKEWAQASITGRATYTELQYLLSSVVGTAVTSTPAAGATQWQFTPSTRADDAPKTFTVEHGSGVRSDRFTYGLVTEIGMNFSRSSIEVTGSMLARAIEDGVAMTSTGVDALPLIPVLPTEVTVYLDDTAVALGTTKLTRMISGTFTLGGRFGPVWVLDAANPSFVNHIETEPSLNASLTLQADNQGMALLETLRKGDSKFLRIEAIGPVIAGGTENYRLTLDLACKISDTGGFSDQDGVYAIEFTALGVHDGVWDKAMQITLVNDQATL